MIQSGIIARQDKLIQALYHEETADEEAKALMAEIRAEKPAWKRFRPKPKRLNRNDQDLVLPENQEACSHKLADLLVFYADFDDLVIISQATCLTPHPCCHSPIAAVR